MPARWVKDLQVICPPLAKGNVEPCRRMLSDFWERAELALGSVGIELDDLERVHIYALG